MSESAKTCVNYLHSTDIYLPAHIKKIYPQAAHINNLQNHNRCSIYQKLFSPGEALMSESFQRAAKFS